MPNWIEQVAGIIALMMLFNFADGEVNNASTQDSPQKTGASIITDRLSGKDLRRWEAIKRIVFAEDIEGQTLHPELRSLWDRLDRSGHMIYIEMRASGRAISNTAGLFHIERFDPEGQRHIATIALYPEIIDHAYVGPNENTPEAFIPFQGLSKEERYAETLGHEMAHAVYILSDLDRARMVKEKIQDTNDLFLSYGRRYGYSNLEPEMLRRLDLRDTILKELEESADAEEMLVWREILLGREAKKTK